MNNYHYATPQAPADLMITVPSGDMLRVFIDAMRHEVCNQGYDIAQVVDYIIAASTVDPHGLTVARDDMLQEAFNYLQTEPSDWPNFLAIANQFLGGLTVKLMPEVNMAITNHMRAKGMEPRSDAEYHQYDVDLVRFHESGDLTLGVRFYGPA